MIGGSDAFQAGFIFGSICAAVITTVVDSFIHGMRYKELLRDTNYLIVTQQGIVTVSDLVFKSEITPQKAEKFLKKLAQQLKVEAEVDESGAVYYAFNSGKKISKRHRLIGDS